MREKWVDVMKGIAIITVVAYHAKCNNYLTLTRLLTNIMIPIFYFCSGFLFDNGKFTLSRLRKLYVPLIVANTVILVLNNLVPFMHSFYGRISLIRGLLIVLVGGHESAVSAPSWFIVALIFIQLFFWFITSALKKIDDRYVSIALFVVFGLLSLACLSRLDSVNYVLEDSIYGFSLIPNLILGIWIFSMGYCIKCNGDLIIRIPSYAKFAICSLSAIILMGIETYKDYSFDFRSGASETKRLIPIVIMCGLILCLGIVKDCTREDGILSSVLAYCGRHSIWIALYHLLGFQFIGFIQVCMFGKVHESFQWTNTCNDSLWWALICTITGLAMPLLIEALFTRCKKKISSANAA